MNTIRHESGATASHHRQYVAAQDDPNNNLGVFAESAVRGQSMSQAAFDAWAFAELTSRTVAIVDAMRNPEPYAVNVDAAGQYLRVINFAPNYASCP